MNTIVTMASATTPAERLLAESVAASGIPSDATIIYASRNRVARVVRQSRSYIIKEFCVPNIVNRLAYTTVRRSKARRSMEHALRLIHMGFLSPRPIAWMERRHGPLLGLSYYICLEVQGHDVRFLSGNPDAPELLPALAAEIGRLHKAGVLHKDFTPGNVLYTRDGDDFKFYYIDLNRMAFGIHDRRLLGNFGTIAELPISLRLARLYAPHSPYGLTPAEAEEEARRARARFLSSHPQARAAGE